MSAGRRLTWASAGLVAVLVLAAWLRLRQLDLAQYADDQAIALRIAHDILDGGIRTVGLASSSGASNPPLYVYIVAAAVAVHDGLLFATATVAVASVLAIAVAYVVIRPRFGRGVALTTTVFFATAPWAVLYGRFLWQQNYLPIVAVSLLWTLFVVLERDRTRVVVLVPLLVVVAFQLNLSALTLIVPAVALLVYRARDVHWGYVGAGIVLGLLSLAPWLAHVAKHGFHDVSLFFSNGRGHHGGATGSGFLEAVRQLINVTSAEGWTGVTGPQHQGGAAWVLGRVAGLLVVVLLAVGLVVCITHVVRERHDLSMDARRRGLLVVWLLGTCAVFLASKRSGVAPYYFLVDYPATFLVAALGLSSVVGPLGRRAGLVSATVVVAVAAGFVGFTLSFHSFLRHHDGATGAYDVVYKQTAALSAAARARNLHVAFGRAEYLVSGHLNPPDGTPSRDIVQVRDRLHDQSPLPCSGRRRWFGPLEACFPRR